MNEAPEVHDQTHHGFVVDKFWVKCRCGQVFTSSTYNAASNKQIAHRKEKAND